MNNDIEKETTLVLTSRNDLVAKDRPHTLKNGEVDSVKTFIPVPSVKGTLQGVDTMDGNKIYLDTQERGLVAVDLGRPSSRDSAFVSEVGKALAGKEVELTSLNNDRHVMVSEVGGNQRFSKDFENAPVLYDLMDTQPIQKGQNIQGQLVGVHSDNLLEVLPRDKEHPILIMGQGNQPKEALRHLVGQSVDIDTNLGGKMVVKEYREKKIKQGLTQKQEYPRMDGHLKEPDGSWRSVGLYVDKNNHPRSVVTLENKELGTQEKLSVLMEERHSEKTGKNYLIGKSERADGSTLFVSVAPAEKGQDQWLAASFSEKRGQEWTQIKGVGGSLKPNSTMQAIENDRTAQYVKDRLGVDVLKNKDIQQSRESAGREISRV